MNLLMLNGWAIVPIATVLGLNEMIFHSLASQAKTTSIAQSIPLVVQAKCSASDLSRSSPPFRCVTPRVFGCLKRNNAGDGGSLEYRGDNKGEIVVKSGVAGQVALLGFNFNPSSETLDLSVKKRYLPVQDQQIWNGFRSTLSKCR